MVPMERQFLRQHLRRAEENYPDQLQLLLLYWFAPDSEEATNTIQIKLIDTFSLTLNLIY